MPVFIERQLEQEADKKGFTGERKAKYIYGAMNNMGMMKGNQETAKGKAVEKKHHIAEKMGIKKRMMSREMEKNRSNPKHGFRHLLAQGASKKYQANMEKDHDERMWKYARENRMSDKRIF